MHAAAKVLLASTLAVGVLMPPPADAAGNRLSDRLVPPTKNLPQIDTKSTDTWPVNSRLLAVGAGAVMGAVAFNVLSAPFGVVPFAGGALAAVPVSVAMGSRLIAVTAAGAGALGANWLYDRWTGQQSDYAYFATLGAGALAGVAVGNYLAMGTLGVPPYYVGAGVADAAGALASPAAQAASRVYAVGSAVLGAWAADWIYRR
jgi:hypothetical protein